MNVKERFEEWKKTPLTENIKIDVTLFREIVKNARRIENRTFGFKISKRTILENLKWGEIIAFNGFRAFTYGSQACYRLSFRSYDGR